MAKKKESNIMMRLGISAALLVSFLIIGSIIALLFSASTEISDANTAIIRVTGPIMGSGSDGVFSAPVSSSTEIVNLLEEAQDDSDIIAVIIEINSPGGSAVASDEIGQAIKEIRAEGKPVVSWIREIGASGGYWVASSSDHIVANRMSITGSIGVISSYLEFAEFIDDWNVTYNRLVAGDNKDIGDPFRELDSLDRLFLQRKLDKIHDFFIAEIATNRNMSTDDVRAIADGSFYLGVEAFDAGLIDELGGKDEAVAYLENRTGEEIKTKVFETEKGFFEALTGVFAQDQTPNLESIARTRQDAIPMLR